ncbi:hypothetical protein PpBr36_07226 [Pyricularia pennisetigena]|uniref:hypothetical protein n=1 Tax=Pyricularia pennisetigena TaxID=1578925 RepID=UPI00114E7714|nr:hypothetical protein PpBr36_07226 [Pyricularia pennisetigena]TLS25408.1 hypothetical protein PpBr36_07226 [Pyricularia pennisetigena]
MATNPESPLPIHNPPPTANNAAPQPAPPAQPVQPAQPVSQRQVVQPVPRTRDTFNGQALGRETNARVKQARVLMVGAGGIGCELLKNLALAGFGEIHAVDLDTIDLSNLNRQFLFRHEHIKKSKAKVAKEAAQKFNPNVKIEAHEANIKSPQFNVQWFRSFAVVFNALDNLDARRHVNRMCLAADVPLIDSGTTGFNGQVQVTKKGVTACYDCEPKDPPKSFPVCTIRSTPSQPIHCIVWGKSYLLNEIFGTSEDESAFDHSADQNNAEEVAELKREALALRAIRDSIGTDKFPQMLFDKVFKADVERLRSMTDMWKDRKPPTPLDFETLKTKSAGDLNRTDAILKDSQRLWSLEENFSVFIDSLGRLSKRILELRNNKTPESPEPIIEFDKDDQDTLDFVASSANIRSHIFGIEGKSLFDIKQMAGNIIPAIATTNAIVAGLCVLEAFKVLKGQYEAAKEAFLTPFRETGRIGIDRPRKPNPDCPVCSVFQVSVIADLSRATLDDLVGFVKQGLGFGEKDFSVHVQDGKDLKMLYDVEETENLPKMLTELGVSADSFVTVMDDDDDGLVNVVMLIEASKTADDNSSAIQASHPDKKLEIPKKPAKKPSQRPTSNGAVVVSNGTDLTLGDDTEKTQQNPKRPREGGEADEAANGREPKKAKINGGTDDVVVVTDEGGAFLSTWTSLARCTHISNCAQSSIKIENAAMSVRVGGQEESGIGYFLG